MKPITEQRWQEIIADCEKLIEHTEHLLLSADLSIGWRKAHENNLLKHQIALASLTAVPFAWIHPNMLDDMDGGRISGRVWNSPVDEMSGEERLPVYTAPPVPVVKFPAILDLVESYTGHASAQDLKMWAFAVSESKRLNGLGE
ncbi:MAG: hypothetical protein [Bacteriophage sp.]|nr:MAG: hypothetical protein [Bacteriophage sp.]